MSANNFKEQTIKAIREDLSFREPLHDEGAVLELRNSGRGSYLITSTERSDYFKVIINIGTAMTTSLIRIADNKIDHISEIDPDQVLRSYNNYQEMLKELNATCATANVHEKTFYIHPNFRENREDALNELKMRNTGNYLLCRSQYWGKSGGAQFDCIVKAPDGSIASNLINITEQGFYIGLPPSRYLQRFRGPGVTLEELIRGFNIVEPSSDDAKKWLEEYRAKLADHLKKRTQEIEAEPNYKNAVLSGREIESILESRSAESYLISRSPEAGYFILSVLMPPVVAYKTINARFSDEIGKVIKEFIEAVRKEVEAHKNSIKGRMIGYDVKKIAEDSEASTRELSGNIGMMAAIRAKYGEKYKELGGHEKILQEFMEYVKNQFLAKQLVFDVKWLANKKDAELLQKLVDKKPLTQNEQESDLIKIFMDGFKLPLNPTPEFLKKFSEAGQTEIIKQYLINPFHSAWRYFMNPNPLMDPKASYANHDSLGNSTHAAISEDSRRDFAYLWLAASDSTIVPIRDMTTEQMKALFAEEIAYIGRGHNWDELDKMEKTKKESVRKEMVKNYGKVVDDLKLDNPSCASGVTGRLMQSVLGNPITETPEARPLNFIILRNHIGDLVTQKFNEYLAQKDARFIKELLRIHDAKNVLLEDLTDVEQKIYEEFKITREDINKLIKEIKQLYGDRIAWQPIESEGVKSYLEFIVKQASRDPWEVAYERMKAVAEYQVERFHQEESKKVKDEKSGKTLDAMKRATQEMKEETKSEINQPGGKKTPQIIFSMNLPAEQAAQEKNTRKTTKKATKKGKGSVSDPGGTKKKTPPKKSEPYSP